MSHSRKPTRFEALLLVLAILAIGVGYGMVHQVLLSHGVASFESAVSLMLWMGLILFVILVLVSENSKEELKTIIRQQHDELRLLRDDLKRKH